MLKKIGLTLFALLIGLSPLLTATPVAASNPTMTNPHFTRLSSTSFNVTIDIAGDDSDSGSVWVTETESPFQSWAWRTAWTTALSDGNYNHTFTDQDPATTYQIFFMHGPSTILATIYVTSVATPATVVTEAADSVTSTTATLNGNLTSMGSFVSVATYFEYGLTTGYGTTAGYDFQSSITTFNEAITGLTPGTTYHYRAVAYGDAAVNGSDATFTTSLADTSPTIETRPIPSYLIQNTYAWLQGYVTSMGNRTALDVSLEYGPTTGYGNTLQAWSNAQYYGIAYAAGTLAAITPETLSPGTTYHYRAKAIDVYNNTYYGADMTFETPPLTGADDPVVVTINHTFISGTTVTLNGNLTSMDLAKRFRI